MAHRLAGSIDYVKVSRRMGSVITYHQVWKGSDHLLMTKEIGFTEEYKRFYFSDIQAFIIKRTLDYLVWSIVLPIIALFVAGIAATNEAPRGFYIGLVIVFLIIWAIHLLKGPTCKCWIQTGINKERMPMFRRVRQAQKFWRKMEPELIAVQGAFSLEEMDRQGAIVAESPAPEVPPMPALDHEEV